MKVRFLELLKTLAEKNGGFVLLFVSHVDDVLYALDLVPLGNKTIFVRFCCVGFLSLVYWYDAGYFDIAPSIPYLTLFLLVSAYSLYTLLGLLFDMREYLHYFSKIVSFFISSPFCQICGF